MTRAIFSQSWQLSAKKICLYVTNVKCNRHDSFPIFHWDWTADFSQLPNPIHRPEFFFDKANFQTKVNFEFYEVDVHAWAYVILG